MERVVAGTFRFELIGEDGDVIGTVASETAWTVGDIVPFAGHMFEVRDVQGSTLHVRRVI